MQVTFQTRDTDGLQMRELSVQRVQFAFRRMSAFVHRATRALTRGVERKQKTNRKGIKARTAVLRGTV